MKARGTEPVADSVVCTVQEAIDPIDKPAHELAIVVSRTCREVEVPVGADRTDRAGSHAQLALQAGVVVKLYTLLRDLGVNQHGVQENEIAELGMDDVAVDAHMAQSCGHGYRLVGDHPDLAGEAVHFHGKAHRGIDRPVSIDLEHGDDCASDVVDPIARMMELEVGYRTGGASNRFPIHPADDAHQPLGPGEVAENIIALVVELRSPDGHKTNVVRPRVQTDAAEPLGVQNVRRRLLRTFPIPG